MACSGCNHNPTPAVPPKTTPHPESVGTVVEASESPSNKVRLRYFGGGSKVSTGGGCSTCKGSKGGYVIKTTETIRFVSEDEPDGWFSQTFSIGRDYYVTPNQAEYLLTLTYRNPAGQTVHKFIKQED